jgi:replicative DNA helicase
VIGGRPGAGKTLIKDQIIREAFALNPDTQFRVLEFSFEMIMQTSCLRDFSASLGKSYKYLCSAEGNKLTREEIVQCYDLAKTKVNYPIDTVEQPCTVNEMRDIIDKYINEYQTKTIITLDHSILLKKAPYHRDKYEMLYEFGEMLTEIKRIYPITMIVLSQLNRSVESPERNEDGKYGNYILDSDIFGGDALLQHADLVVGLNRPAKQKIKFYGPDRYIIEDDKTLVMHFLKARNGDNRMSFFKAQFEKMSVIEMETPATQERRIKTT